MAGQIIKRGENTWYIRIFLGRDADGKRNLQPRITDNAKDGNRQNRKIDVWNVSF